MARFDEIEMTAAERAKLAAVEALADVTDFTNVNAALAAADATIDLNSQALSGVGAITTTGLLTAVGGTHTLGASAALTIDGSTNARTATNEHDALIVSSISGSSETHTVHIIHDAAGFSDTSALDINFDTGSHTAGGHCDGINITVDDLDASGGFFHGLVVRRLATNLDDIAVIDAGANVDPVHQHTGTYAAPDQAALTYDDSLASYTDITATANAVLFSGDDDYLYVINASNFDAVRIILGTGATVSILPTFEYSQAGSTWSQFTPEDGTGGFRNSGFIAFESGDLTGWADITVDGITGRAIRIKRTRNTLVTPPQLAEVVQVLQATLYYWNASGNLSVASINAAALPAMVGDAGAGGTKGAVPAPGAGDYAAGKYLDAGGNWTSPTGGETWIQSRMYQHGAVSPTSSTSAMWGDGVEGAQPIEVDTTSTAAQDANGNYFSQTSAAASGSTTSVHSSATIYRTGAHLIGAFRFKVPDWTSVRMFAGFTSAVNICAADDQAGDYVGVTYSTDRPDAAFRTVSKDNSTQSLGLFTPTVVPSNSKYYILIVEGNAAGSSIAVSLYDEDQALLGTATLTNNLPTATTSMRAFCGLEARAASARSIYQYGYDTRQG